MSRIKRCSIVFILAFLSFLFLPCVTSAQVILTEEEAATLGHELSIAKTSIQKSKQELRTAKERLAELSRELELSKQSLIVQNYRLQDVNKYLNEQEQEHKRQIKRLNRQRNIAYIIAAAFVYIAVRK